MWAVVPVKDFGCAKQRLAGALGPVERRGLFAAMLEDVLVALRREPTLDGIALVTRDPDAAILARRYGARVIEESENRGQSVAVTAAAQRLATEGAWGMITVPGDVPLATSREIGDVLAIHGPAPAVTIVPARDGHGSNCVVCSPPDVIPFHFGDSSFRPHLEAARSRGITPRVLRRPGLALDIDTPDDLELLLSRPGRSRTQAYLARTGIARHPGGQGRRRARGT